MRTIDRGRNARGQGMVEYALILALTAVVVIAALTILGPQTGVVYSNVSRSLNGGIAVAGSLPTAVPTPIPTWHDCATEGGYCAFTGTFQVRYGVNNIYALRTATNGISCSNEVFGDPVYGYTKYCDYLQ